jgi:hypothetical protein
MLGPYTTAERRGRLSTDLLRKLFVAIHRAS